MSNKRITIVAEIGCNHGGDAKLAKEMIIAAKECGADAVKFQTFVPELLISVYAPKAEYQKKTTGADESQLDMIRKLELLPGEYLKLRDFAESIGLVCFSSPFDLQSVEFLEKSGQKIWKIPAGEITNLPYLEKIGGITVDGKQVIVSAGMATVEEISACIDVLVKAGTDKKDIIILHCNTEYPTPDEDVNLYAIDHLKACFAEHEIGFSDHSVGAVAAIAAASKNIVMIEKHFTLDKNMEGPDHKASADPEEFAALCKAVRRVEVMNGLGKKIVTNSESKNKQIARKSIVAACDIRKGEVFTAHNLICKRPGGGISPMHWYDVIGKVAECDFEKDRPITVTGIEGEN